MVDNRASILDAARDVLGARPDAGIGEIAAAAGVVRRTVYGHFPARADLVSALMRRAVDEILAALEEAVAAASDPAVAWSAFVVRLWSLTDRYRVLVRLRRGEHGPEIHAALADVDAALARLVERGRRAGEFTAHLPAELLGQVAWSAVFVLADRAAADGFGAREAAIASLLVLGVPEARALDLAEAALAAR